MSDMLYMRYGNVAAIRIDRHAPTYNRSASGYGSKIPTRYSIALFNKNGTSSERFRRVYAICYGNAASLYIIVNGERHFIDTDTEYAFYAAVADYAQTATNANKAQHFWYPNYSDADNWRAAFTAMTVSGSTTSEHSYR